MKLLALCLLVAVATAHKKHDDKKHYGEDKTKAVLSSAYGSHVQDFKNEFNVLFANRPTGRPDAKKFMNAIEKKYKEAKDKLKAQKPLEKKDHHMQHEAEKLLKKQKYEAKELIEAWIKQVEADRRQQEEAAKQALFDASPMGAALSAFKQDFEKAFSGRPTGRPDVKKFFKSIEKKYKEAKENLKGLRPTGRPSKGDHDLFHRAEKMLKDHMKDAKKKVDAWKKQVEAAKHAAKHQNKPDYHHKKPDHHHKKPEYKNDKPIPLYEKPESHHDKHKKPKHHHDKHDKKQEEDDMKALLAASPLGAALSAFKQHFENAFAGRPTGRPDVKDFLKSIEKKYKEAKENLKGLRPTGRPSKEGHDLFHRAEKMLKDHMKDAHKKIDAWKKQVHGEKHGHKYHKKH